MLFQYPGGKEGVAHIWKCLVLDLIYLFIWHFRRFVRKHVQTFGMNILSSFSDLSRGHSQTVSRHIPCHPAHIICLYSHPDHFESTGVENVFQGNVARLQHYTTVVQKTAVEISSFDRGKLHEF